MEDNKGDTPYRDIIGIVPKGYPEKRLSYEQQKGFLAKLKADSNLCGLRLKVDRLIAHAGYFTIICHNLITTEWMWKNIGKIKRDDGIELEVVEEEKIPPSKFASAQLPATIDSTKETILSAIREQNNLQHIDDWRSFEFLMETETLAKVIFTLSPVAFEELERQNLEITLDGKTVKFVEKTWADLRDYKVKTSRAIGLFYGCSNETNEAILAEIRSKNPELNAGLWEVISREQKPGAVSLLLKLNYNSYTALQAARFQVKFKDRVITFTAMAQKKRSGVERPRMEKNGFHGGPHGGIRPLMGPRPKPTGPARPLMALRPRYDAPMRYPHEMDRRDVGPMRAGPGRGPGFPPHPYGRPEFMERPYARDDPYFGRNRPFFDPMDIELDRMEREYLAREMYPDPRDRAARRPPANDPFFPGNQFDDDPYGRDMPSFGPMRMNASGRFGAGRMEPLDVLERREMTAMQGGRSVRGNRGALLRGRMGHPTEELMDSCFKAGMEAAMEMFERR